MRLVSRGVMNRASLARSSKTSHSTLFEQPTNQPNNWTIKQTHPGQISLGSPFTSLSYGPFLHGTATLPPNPRHATSPREETYPFLGNLTFPFSSPSRSSSSIPKIGHESINAHSPSESSSSSSPPTFSRLLFFFLLRLPVLAGWTGGTLSMARQKGILEGRGGGVRDRK